MINPIKIMKNYKNAKINSSELELSGKFIQWALNNGYDLFKLAFDKNAMEKCVSEYEKYVEGFDYEDKSI